MTEWFEERLYDHFRQAIRIDDVVYSGKSAFQDILIFENAFFGRVLVLDDVVQTTERDECYYHEMLTHLPMLGHGSVRSVLVVGGGDGGMLKEALKHPIERGVLVDIDGDVIEVSKKYLPTICGGAFEDPRSEIIVGDGIDYVRTARERFDLIIVDSTDPIGPGEVLFRKSFYESCRSLLSDTGILVTQNGVPYFQGPELTSTYRHFSDLFPFRGVFLSPVPHYVGAHMAFGWASKGTDVAATDRATIAGRYRDSGIETRFYNPDIHAAAFALPNNIRALLD